MDVFSFLSYINKFSLLAFFITAVVVGYQIYVMKKEKTNEQKPIIPDFKENEQSNTATNYTRLPSFLTKKITGAVNYSKLIFLIIFLMTAIVIIIVLALIKRNSKKLKSSIEETTLPNNTQTVVFPTKTVSLTLTPTVKPTTAQNAENSISPTPTPTKKITPSPTEIILAKAPTLTPTVNAISPSSSKQDTLKTLPETGSIEKALLIIGVAISTIFFSFWL